MLPKKLKSAVHAAMLFKIRVAKDVAQAFPQLDSHLSTRLAFLKRRLGLVDRKDEDRRGDEADRVDEDRGRRLQPTDQDAGETWTSELSTRAADLELRVAVDDLFSLDERRQVRLVRDVEEDRGDADAEADPVHLPDRQRIEKVSNRDGREQQRPRSVTGDENRAPRQAVDPDAGRQADEEKRQKLGRRQRGDLERARINDIDGRERQGKLADLRAELADSLGRPELEEVRVPPEAA